MKKLPLLLLGLLFTAFAPVSAQSPQDEMALRAFTRAFMAAYNAGNLSALSQLYTADAVRIDDSGQQFKGIANIATYFADQFRQNDATLLLRQRGLSWSDAQHAWIAHGTYTLYGLTHVYDIPIDQTGTYANTMVMENGQWKIARSELKPLVRTLIHQEVRDLGEWTSILRGHLFTYQASVLSHEFGTLANAPGTAYALIHWASQEAAQAFFARSGWESTVESLDPVATQPPVVLFLEGK